MKITKDEVLYVANLARLEINPGNIDRFAEQIGQILDYVETLNTVDTEGVKPTSHAISLTNAFREDKELGHLERDAVLYNAPDKDDDGSFLVPKVVG